MVKFIYDEVFTEVQGSFLELGSIRGLFSFEDGSSLFEEGYLFSGLLNSATQYLDSLELEYEIIGLPSPPELDEIGVPAGLLKNCTLRDYQIQSLEKALYNRRGILHLSTGGGKTMLAAALAKIMDLRGKRSIMVVPGKNSMYQTRDRFRKAGIDGVGIIGDDVCEADSNHIIAVVNSLYKRCLRREDSIISLLEDTELLMLMECQHAPSKMWRTVGSFCKAPFRLGLSATPFKKYSNPSDIEDYILIGLTGEVISRVPDHLLMNRGYLATPKISFLNIYHPKVGGNNWQHIKKKCVVENEYRNSCIVRIASTLCENNLNVLTLVNEVKHGVKLAKIMSDLGKPCYFYYGGSNLKLYENGKEIESSVVSIDEFSEKLAGMVGYNVVGSPAVHEDADFPEVNALIVASAGRAYRGVIQRAGRVLRAKDEENIAYLIDFNDYSSFVLLNQSKERRRFYEHKYDKATKLEFFDFSSVDVLIKNILEKKE